MKIRRIALRVLRRRESDLGGLTRTHTVVIRGTALGRRVGDQEVGMPRQKKRGGGEMAHQVSQFCNYRLLVGTMDAGQRK